MWIFIKIPQNGDKRQYAFFDKLFDSFCPRSFEDAEQMREYIATSCFTVFHYYACLDLFAVAPLQGETRSPVGLPTKVTEEVSFRPAAPPTGIERHRARASPPGSLSPSQHQTLPLKRNHMQKTAPFYHATCNAHSAKTKANN